MSDSAPRLRGLLSEPIGATDSHLYLVCDERTGAVVLLQPSHHPSGCCTLVVVEERPPLDCKVLWVYINSRKPLEDNLKRKEDFIKVLNGPILVTIKK